MDAQSITPPHSPNKLSGFTILEVVVSASILSLLIATVLSIGVESVRLVAFADTDRQIQYESQRSIRKIAEIIRKFGWNTTNGIAYPHVDDGGSSFSFNLLSDTDGNGFAFDGATGELEWGSDIFSISLTDGELRIVDLGGGIVPDTNVLLIGRNVQNILFETYLEDPTIHFKEIRITLTTAKADSNGNMLTYTTVSSIHMRN